MLNHLTPFICLAVTLSLSFFTPTQARPRHAAACQQRGLPGMPNRQKWIASHHMAQISDHIKGGIPGIVNRLNATSFWNAFGLMLSFDTSVTDRTADIPVLNSRHRAALAVSL